MRLGFLGIGTMGSGMVANLREAGFEVAIYDVRRGQADPLLEMGATWSEGPLAVARASDVLLTSLPGPPEVEAVSLGAEGILAGLGPGSIFVDLSTNSPTLVRRIDAEAQARGIEMLDAPVAGGQIGARDGTLTIMVGGSRSAFERCTPIFRAIGRDVIYCGEIGAGTICKLVNNMISLSTNLIVGEGLTLGVKAGVPLATLANVVSKSTGGNWKLANSFPRWLFKGNFAPGFAVDLATKDLQLGTGLARELQVPLDFATLVLNRFVEAQLRGWGGEHGDAVVKLLEEKAGVELRLPDET
ncbi:MAG: NAD(P)-dependent oxidoreductase [Chloroflexi bacterium]|nr:NAD(P)-dependent oxidoreductase [Chloroflexota bacterium]